MVLTTAGRPISPWSFILNRCARIIPIYWIVTAILIILFAVGFNPVGVTNITIEYILKSMFFIPFERDGYIQPIVTVGWTLNYEMFFYALFAISLTIQNHKIRTMSMFLFFVLFVAINFNNSDNFYIKYYSNPIIIEFLFGIILAEFYRSHLKSAHINNALILSISFRA